MSSVMETNNLIKVVRCKNCKHWQKSYDEPYVNVEHGICFSPQWDRGAWYRVSTTDRDYCSFAKKREENGN